jgi:hypothetical protein
VADSRVLASPNHPTITHRHLGLAANRQQPIAAAANRLLASLLQLLLQESPPKPYTAMPLQVCRSLDAVYCLAASTAAASPDCHASADLFLPSTISLPQPLLHHEQAPLLLQDAHQPPCCCKTSSSLAVSRAPQQQLWCPQRVVTVTPRTLQLLRPAARCNALPPQPSSSRAASPWCLQRFVAMQHHLHCGCCAVQHAMPLHCRLGLGLLAQLLPEPLLLAC